MGQKNKKLKVRCYLNLIAIVFALLKDGILGEKQKKVSRHIVLVEMESGWRNISFKMSLLL